MPGKLHLSFIIVSMKGSLKFLITVIVVTLICAVCQLLWNTQTPERYHFLPGYALLGVFSVSVTLIHFLLMAAAKGDPQSFVRVYMASTMFKFLFYLLMLVVLLMFSEFDKRILILHFLFYYAVFTVLEVGFLYNAMQKNKG